MIPFRENTRTCKLTYGDRKQIGGFLEVGMEVERNREKTKGPKDTSGVTGTFTGLMVVRIAHMHQNLTNHTLEILAVYCMLILPQ